MSTEPAQQRNPLLVPLVALGILAVVVIGFLLSRSGGDDPAQAGKTPTKSAAATPTAATDKLTGTADAPKGIRVKAATVARSSTGFGLAADLPDIDLKVVDTVTLVLDEDGDVRWNLRTFRDSRGAFITPELFRVEDGPDEQFACNGGKIRIASTRMTVTLPLACLGEPDKPLRARLEITDRDGDTEKTSTSKVLAAPR